MTERRAGFTLWIGRRDAPRHNSLEPMTMSGTKTRKGIVEACKGSDGRTYYRGRIKLADNSFARITLEDPQLHSKTGALDAVAAAQEIEDEGHAIYNAKIAKIAKNEATAADAAGETCDQFFKRYHAYAIELGQTNAKKKRTCWTKWIAPLIGPKPMVLVTKNDIEDIRDALDVAIAAWTKNGGKSSGKKGREISGKTATNVWTALTSSFKAATSSKRRDLRVLDGKPNPCLGVEPPGDSTSRKVRRKTFIYPREAVALLACKTIPRDWREVYAIALYTYLRPGELRVLTWSDVDFDAGHINITKAWDYQDEKIKPPKTANGVRSVPIEASLLPLLERMKEDAGEDSASALVVPRLSAFGEDHLAEQFRRHLKLAKVDRVELHTSTLTHVQGNFRSCRDTGITWLAMTGLGVDKMLRRAGHDDVNTTMGYVKLAEDLSGKLGTPFGPLPERLLESERSTFGSTLGKVPLFTTKQSAGGGIRTPDLARMKRPL
jgi:integrase